MTNNNVGGGMAFSVKPLDCASIATRALLLLKRPIT